ncbi:MULTISPECIES: acyl-CoA thioesterase II [Aeromicrobium]|uniref:acyl-CoA thioesterase n=1 Tax=Aeromicrobium TaxID=2040 RepID=UPI0006FE5AC9|nr:MULTISPECIES: acyl-CoA thioesterase II [Aeromicrobium]KQX75996.1 acyl-CoA thioesterase II [Aeromicrobium sp. Root472D3]MBD8606539.1 acyl-CoA thioesterase II [Aeromicrobium sp. CFBP 8757]MCL8250785.1 acyl-CoA thioesterase II [Aeromicrobium fastidiosum]
MPASVDEVIGLLDLERLEEGLYRGSQPAASSLKRVFGGQVAAQALMAAQLTVPDDRFVHSLHLYFILGGDPSIPIVYDVEDVRDGRSFTTRRVAARQHGEIIFYMTASFQVEEGGWDHQDRMPRVPTPDEATPMLDIVQMRGPEAVEHWEREWASFDMRYIGDNRDQDDPQRALTPAVQRLWFRANGTLPDSRIIHNAAFTYISDLSLLGASLVPHGQFIGSDRVQPASLDHTIWFHRPVRADEWLLYDQTSPSASGARGLSTAHVFSQDGTLVATVAQEGLIRPLTKR